MAGSKGTVEITSEPAGAAYTIFNKDGEAVDNGTTPKTVTLKRGAGYFSAQKYTIKLTKDGCKDCEVQIKNGVSGWYIGGNLLLGGLIGYLIVDPLTGAMWTMQDVHVDMESGPKAQTTGDAIRIVTIDQVPRELRPRLVRIN